MGPLTYGMVPAYGYVPLNTTFDQQLREATNQIGRASRGDFLSRYEDFGGHPGSFANGPSMVKSAYAIVAYWLGVAARLGYIKVLPTANAAVKAAMSLANDSTVGSRAQKAAIIQDAVKALDAAGARSDKRLARVYGILGKVQEDSSMQLSEQAQYEQSTRGIIEGTIKETVKDVGAPAIAAWDFLTLIGSFWTGKIPASWQKNKAGWWALRLTFFGGIAGVGYLYIRPFLTPLIAARKLAVSAAPKTNPRRRRSRR